MANQDNVDLQAKSIAIASEVADLTILGISKTSQMISDDSRHGAVKPR